VSTAAQRYARRRRVRPGFPWEGSFSLPEEAEAYVSGERIQCLLCGKLYRSLGSHINSVHEVNETSYKHRFGIPYRVGLVSAITAKRHAEELTKRISPQERREYVAVARATLRAMVDFGSLEWRPPVASVNNQRAQRFKLVNDAQSCSRSCHACGDTVIVRGARVFYGDEMIRCEQCIAPASRRPYKMRPEDREKLRQWAEDNPERAREYLKARSWWSWRRYPFPLIAYAEKWGASLRIMPELLKAAEESRSPSKTVPRDNPSGGSTILTGLKKDEINPGAPSTRPDVHN
jgi:ROS/MUCR transcriptional regulator protein